MSDDSRDPKSVFDAETVIWPIGDKAQKPTEPTPSLVITEATKKSATRSKINIFDDESTVRAEGEKLKLPSVSFEFLKSIPWATLRKNLGLPLAGLIVGGLVFFGASQYLKNRPMPSEADVARPTPSAAPSKPVVKKQSPTRSESVESSQAPKKEVAVAPAPTPTPTPQMEADSIETKRKWTEIRKVRTADEFLANLGQVLQDSRRSATRP